MAKPLAAMVELTKLIEPADLVGPDHGFDWPPMPYGSGRRLPHAATGPGPTSHGWR